MTTNRIKELESKITKARNDYYNDQPNVSDKVFDTWVDELKLLDPKNKAVTAVGAPVAPSEWKKAKHQIPMGSLDKVNTPDELSKWYTSSILNGEPIFVCEKLDGLSIEVVYERGKFVQAITRGDGLIGEDISVNVIKMGGVQPTLKNNFTGSLRGEIIMTKTTHKKHFFDKANPRNAASGVSKRLDGVDVNKLDILFYQVLGDVDFYREEDQFNWLLANKCKVPNFWSFKFIKDVNAHWRSYQDKDRDKLDYDIDGLVVRFSDLMKSSALGDKDMRPRGAIAFKFDNEAKESIIRAIVWQVGNSGRLTPVATVDPVTLVGATITRASLYNLAYVQELGLDVGATVLVSRANDVIPRIEELVKSTGTIAHAPKKCPECGGKVEISGENINCVNTGACPAQIIGRIKNWIKELNLLEWGDSLVERLVQSGKVNQVSDLYKLSINDLASIDRMGEKSAKKCHDILWQASEVPLEIFLGALSIPMIGGSTIKLIMNAGCDTLDKFAKMKAIDFEQVAGVGPVKASSLAQGITANDNLIAELLDSGVSIKSKISGVLSGKSVCFTGSMKTKRTTLEKMATDVGADLKNSVGKGLTYLVIADPNSTSTKAMAARKLGTVLISEEDFVKMVS